MISHLHCMFLPVSILLLGSIVTIASIECSIRYSRQQLKASQSRRSRAWQRTEVYQAFKPSYQCVFDEIIYTLDRVESDGLSADIYKLSLRLLGGVLPLLSTVAGSSQGQTLLAIGASIASLILLVFGSVAKSDSSTAIAHSIRKNILNFFGQSSGYDGNISDATRFKILVRSINTALDSNAIGAVADAGARSKEATPREDTPVVEPRNDHPSIDVPAPVVTPIVTAPVVEMDDMQTASGAELLARSTFPKISQ